MNYFLFMTDTIFYMEMRQCIVLIVLLYAYPTWIKKKSVLFVCTVKHTQISYHSPIYSSIP